MSEEAPASSWTLRDVRATRDKFSNFRIEAQCVTPDCGWFSIFDLDALIAMKGLDWVVPELVPGLACQACGGDRVKFQLALYQDDPDAPA